MTFPLTSACYLSLLVSAVFWVLPTSVVKAQSEVTTDPPQLKVVGYRGIIFGFPGTVTTRQLFVEMPQSSDESQVISLDLDRTDEMAVFPGTFIQKQKVIVESKQPSEPIIPIQFDLRQAPSSGEFNGKLRLTYSGGTVLVPVTIKVKDYWLFPLIVLLAGTGLGIGLSAYRSRGKPRDEILVRATQLRSMMQADLNLAQAQSFQAWVDAYLVDVETALRGDRWEEAQTLLAQAEAIWNKWRKGRSDWLAQLNYAEQLKQRLTELGASTAYGQAAMRQLEDVVRNLPRLDGPDKLREQLDALAQQINGFTQLQTKIKRLNELSLQLPENPEAQHWRSQCNELERRMQQLRPSDLTDDAELQARGEAARAEITQLETEVEAATQAMNQLIAQHPETEAVVKGLPKLGINLTPLTPAPKAYALPLEEESRGAGNRLKLFTRTSYAVSLILLTGVGFSQLYIDNPIFGANPWKDYFTLLAWGFGAEVTRDSVAKAVRDWGLPGFK